MLVYGDHSETVEPRERLERLSEQIAAIGQTPAGLHRHAKLAGALIEAGQLLQGVADEGWPADGLNRLTWRLAISYVRSWDSRFAQLGDLPDVPKTQLPARVKVKLPEGFAFYAVYPEAYIEAARRLRLSAPPHVIGIRSIGTTLGAVVAAALGAPPPVTVRPFGDPFAREVELPVEIDRHAHYVIVDEGPGLSGSSFGSVADALERSGVPLERIGFLPSHGGELGPKASDAHRKRWAKAQRVAAEFDSSWLAEHFGPLEEFTAGSPWERRKFRAGRAGERILLKFAGLGAIGERKLEMARSLHAAGFAAEPLGFVHGFLIERWREDSRPLAPDEKPIDEIGRYLGARARLFPAADESGAGVQELLAMCRRNISLSLGDDRCGIVDRFKVELLQPCVRRVRTDNKLDRHEWLRLPSGRLLKADALDHHQCHDLVGCQDLAWDVAGAVVEFALNDREAARLIAATGCPVDRKLLEFCLIAYASFRLGRAMIAGDKADAGPYKTSLSVLLDQHVCCETRQKSLVD